MFDISYVRGLAVQDAAVSSWRAPESGTEVMEYLVVKCKRVRKKEAKRAQEGFCATLNRNFSGGVGQMGGESTRCERNVSRHHYEPRATLWQLRQWCRMESNGQLPQSARSSVPRLKTQAILGKREGGRESKPLRLLRSYVCTFFQFISPTSFDIVQCTFLL